MAGSDVSLRCTLPLCIEEWDEHTAKFKLIQR